MPFRLQSDAGYVPARSATWRKLQNSSDTTDAKEEQGREFEISKDSPSDEVHEARRRIAPTTKHDPDRDRVNFLVADIAKQLGDRAPLSSTTTRLVNILRRSGVSFDEFATAIYEARTRTLERTNIHRDERGTYRFPCFVATLEDILGLRDGVSTTVRHEENLPEEERPPAQISIAHEAVAATTVVDAAVAPLEDVGDPRLTTDEGGKMLGLAGDLEIDLIVPTLGADEAGMKQASPSRAWPMELTAMAIPDVPTYIRVCKRGPFPDPASSIAYAQRRLGGAQSGASPQRSITAAAVRSVAEAVVTI